jgi:hypothetical protein
MTRYGILLTTRWLSNKRLNSAVSPDFCFLVSFIPPLISTFLLVIMYFSLTVAALVGSASSAILWDGRFNDMSSSTDLNNWSWSNQVGPYQYYIVNRSHTPCLALLTLTARLFPSHELRQSVPKLQEPRGFRKQPRSQDHFGQYRILEWPEHAENGVDPPDNGPHQLGQSMVPLQHHEVCDEPSKLVQRASDCFF